MNDYPYNFDHNTPDKVSEESIIEHLGNLLAEAEESRDKYKREAEIYLDCLRQVEGHLQTALNYLKDLDYSIGSGEDD